MPRTLRIDETVEGPNVFVVEIGADAPRWSKTFDPSSSKSEPLLAFNECRVATLVDELSRKGFRVFIRHLPAESATQGRCLLTYGGGYSGPIVWSGLQKHLAWPGWNGLTPAVELAVRKAEEYAKQCKDSDAPVLHWDDVRIAQPPSPCHPPSQRAAMLVHSPSSPSRVK